MKTTTLFIKLMLSMTLALSATVGALEVGDRVAITCGDLHGKGGSTNTLKILEYKG